MAALSTRVRIVPLVVFAAAAFAMGAWIGSDGAIGTQALRLLAAMGAPQYDAYKELYAARDAAQGGKEIDYLLFFEREKRILSEAYFTEHPQVRVVDKTIFDNAIVVALPEPTKPWVDDLKRQPFVWMLLRDRPLFFCH